MILAITSGVLRDWVTIFRCTHMMVCSLNSDSLIIGRLLPWGNLRPCLPETTSNGTQINSRREQGQ
ncbi:hypothetical protein G113_13883 [Aeromonas molluscorum 848]|uniref:Uncharacterized protein n=1 Tax=Aeromonas molluscorum 848 TaxID=1268236 RepID=R1F3Q2_9GAMM|nr:hypothetical protein G113_13883 [Aeromonas molluscorum 848]